MRVRIHRGTKEIGGTCIEVESRGKRIVLDVGLPLDAPDEGHEFLLPQVPGFRDHDDSLLMEGTTIGRAGTGAGFATETDLEKEFVRKIKQTKGIHFVWTSAQNIDRIVTIFRAAKRAGRVLVIDLYTAVILEATGNNNIPQSGWGEVKLFIPQRQRVHIKKNELFNDLERHNVNRVYPQQLPRLSSRAVMLFRSMMMTDKGVKSILDGAVLSYSMFYNPASHLNQKKRRFLMDGSWSGIEGNKERVLRPFFITTSGQISIPSLPACP